MKKINKANIYDLPVHDSDFLGIRLLQDDSGETELSLDIGFCKGEFEKLADYSSVISSEGNATLLFTCCDWVNISTFCNRTQRDSVDYIDFKKDTAELKQYNVPKDKEHIVVYFTSGSKIECIYKSLRLKKYTVS